MTHEPADRTDPQLAPGAWVRHPGRPDWGLGQVQSVVGARVTVNFEHMGKMAINTDFVTLEVASEDLRS